MKPMTFTFSARSDATSRLKAFSSLGEYAFWVSFQCCPKDVFRGQSALYVRFRLCDPDTFSPILDGVGFSKWNAALQECEEEGYLLPLI
jgi:hypothetical protein